MKLSTRQIVSMSEANQNFSKVAHLAEQQGTVVIFKNNKPKYILVDIEGTGMLDKATGNEVGDAVAELLANTEWL